MKTKTIGLFLAVAVIAAGIWAGACTTPQAPIECNIAAANYLAGTTNFWAKYTLVSGTGTCAELLGEEVGFARYLAPESSEPTIAIRAQEMGDALAGNTFSADIDGTNDCADEEDCAGCDTSTTNPCQTVLESVPRIDPTDAEAKQANALGGMTLYPDHDGICEGSGIQTAVQNFQQEDLAVADGGTETLPGYSLSYRWSNLKVTSTAAVPGTVFTADLVYTKDACRATYQVTGIWPYIQCGSDEDCNPEANLDAGRVIGSGINPAFKPVCNLDVGVCEASVDPTQLR